VVNCFYGKDFDNFKGNAAMEDRIKNILKEIKEHAPFTLFGAFTGIGCMLLFRNFGKETNLRLFQVFHPTHVVLSAMVTAALFKLYKKKTSFVTVLIVGYLGAIGVATVSDCVLPYFGESILGVAVPVHSHAEEEVDEHEEEHEEADVHEDEHEGLRIHLGFIEDWYIVNPAAILGVFIAYFLPRTKFPHAGHVLISTWASSFHVLMNTQRELTPLILTGMLVVLFIAVWLPCCVSDIVFPLLFVKSRDGLSHIHHHH
jgi:hypothetical protein